MTRVESESSDWEVAVIGMAGRFPGAATVGQLWKNLQGGVESIAPLSDDVLRANGVSPRTLDDPRYVKAAGVLGGAELFDASFFGVSAREAELLDPQQRHFLECGWAALEDAGWDPARYPGRIGVYAGAGLNTYLLSNVYPNRAVGDPLTGFQVFIGGDKDFLATRLAFKLGLEGPSITVQTACSTSLVAVHLACQALLAGECEMALAGGVTIRTPDLTGYQYEQGLILSPDGHCRAFDVGAAGSVPASGLGIVVLKRAVEAIRDQDHIHAIIKGTAINNDGAAKVGFTTPRLDGQVRVIQEAFGAAGLAPASIGYIEAHGSGTPVGDAIELGALHKVFAGVAPRSCALGSIKTNIGHTDIAAGVAGLIKAVLCVEHGVIAPSLNCQVPSPALELESGPFYVNTALAPWTAAGPRRAGVSSFGLGGTNAHVVIEEPPPIQAEPSPRPEQLLVLSARTPAALEEATGNLATHLAEGPELEIADVAFTLATGRRAFSHRRAVLVRDGRDAAQALAARAPDRILQATADTTGRAVAFLLPGIGDHHPRMGQALYQREPAFREAFDRCGELLEREFGLRLAELLFAGDPGPQRTVDLRAMFGRAVPASDEGGRRLDRTAVVQPATFTMEYALAALWASWGVRPAAMFGYSIGEYVAAALAGVWTLEDALRVVARRAQILEELPEGAMLAVSLSEGEVGKLVGNGVWLAAVNTPGACVLSGEPAAIAEIERRLTENGSAGAMETRLPLGADATGRPGAGGMPALGEDARSGHPLRLEPHRLVDHRGAGHRPRVLGRAAVRDGAFQRRPGHSLDGRAAGPPGGGARSEPERLCAPASAVVVGAWRDRPHLDAQRAPGGRRGNGADARGGPALAGRGGSRLVRGIRRRTSTAGASSQLPVRTPAPLGRRRQRPGGRADRGPALLSALPPAELAAAGRAHRAGQALLSAPGQRR
jgi:acyl transferase domain-containing protein